MSLVSRELFAFGPYRLDAEGGVLYDRDRVLALPPKQIATLVVLVRSAGSVVDRETLVSQVWPDTFVEEAGLTRNISQLRKAIETGGNTYIETIPKRGYRFVASVTRQATPSGDVRVVERVTQVRVEEELIDDAIAVDRQLPPAVERKRTPLIVSLAALAIVATIGIATVWRGSPFTVANRGPQAIRSLAVLPFRYLNPEATDFLSVGLADTLITRFANLAALTITPTATVLGFAGQHPIEAGKALGVDAVLDGSIQRSSGRVRVTVQLLDVAGGQPLWAGSFDEPDAELLAIQDNVSAAVASLLVPNLGAEGRGRLARRSTSNVVAWQGYLRGRALWATRGSRQLEESIAAFESAIAADPAYALAYTGLAQALMAQSAYQYKWSRDVQPRAKEAALRALEIDPMLAEAHGIIGGIAFTFDHDWTTAERELQRGLSLNPNEASLHQTYSNHLMAMGRLDDSVVEAETAVRLDPQGFAPNSNLTLMLNWARRFEESVAQGRKTMQLKGSIPAFPALQASASYYLMGRQAEATALFEEARKTIGPIPVVVATEARYEVVAGRRDRARVLVEGLERRHKSEVVESIFIAAPWVNVGDFDRAINWLNQAVADRTAYAPYIAIDPSFDALHDDPRFAEVMRVMGLDTVFARVRRPAAISR